MQNFIFETLNLSVSSIIGYVLWLLVEIWLISRIVQSKLVKSTKERIFWIILSLVALPIGILVFFLVTNKRHREKYSRKR
jgi:membrane protein DedA with SNARE-associated domain